MDHFTRLGLPRRVWLDPEIVQEKFLELSTELHPDKAATADLRKEAEGQFAELNQARNVLRDARARTLHFLELSGVSKLDHIQSVPPAALEFFAPVAEATRRAEDLLKQKASAASPMLQARIFEQALECAESLRELRERLRKRISAAEDELREISKRTGEKEPLESAVVSQLQESAALLGFLERWNEQLQGRITALTF